MQNLLRLLCSTLYLSLSQSISPLQNDMNHPLTFIAFLTIVSRLLYYHLFPCYEAVYILYDIIVRVFVNALFDILSDMACSIFQNISTYYILSIKHKVFCICDTDYYGSVLQLLYRFSTLGFVSQPLQNSSVFFRVWIRACLQTKYKTFVRVDFFKCI